MFRRYCPYKYKMSNVTHWLNRNKVALFFVALLMCYIGTRFGALPSGDATENIRQIEKYDIFSRGSHFTFHLLGVAFYSILHFLFKTSAITATEIMLLVVSFLGVFAFYASIVTVWKDKQLALFAAMVYALNSGIWRFSVQSEYVVLVPALMLLSLYAHIRNHPLGAGALCAAALMTSPFSILMAPLYLVTFKSNRLWFKRAGFMVATCILVYLVGSGVVAQDVVEGTWSLSGSLKRFIMLIDPERGLVVLVYGFIRSFHIFLPLMIWGGYIVYKRDKWLFVVSLAVIVMHIPTTLAEARQGAYMFGVYPLVALYAAFALKKIAQRRTSIMVAYISIFALLNFLIVYAEKMHFVNIAQTYQMLDNDPAIPTGTRVFVYPSRKPMAYVTKRLKSVSIESFVTSVFGRGRVIDAAVADGHRMLLVESGARQPDDYFKQALQQFSKRYNVRENSFGRSVIKKQLPHATLQLLKGYPVDVYEITSDSF